MRFVELRSDPHGESIRLHPRITVLQGLDPATRVALVGLVHDVALGEPPDWEGTVDIDGEEQPLAAAVESLGVTAESALVVDAAGLPPLPDSEPSGPADAHPDLDTALAKLADIDERIGLLAEELAAAGKVRSDLKANLASATARIDTEVADRIDHADGALGRAARLAGRPDPWTGASDGEERTAELRALIAEIDEALEDLPSGDRPALAAAVAAARASVASGLVPSPEAAALAQAWASLHQRLRGLESRVEAAGGGTEAVAQRVEAARAAAQAAEEAAAPRAITPEESARLEELHDRMLAAEAKAGRGVRRGTSRAAFDKAEAELQSVLGPLGYPTWAAFRMGNGKASVAPEAIAAHEECQAELEAAEAEWAEVSAMLDADTELQDVLQAIDKALEHATELLGEDPWAAGDRDPKRVSEALEAFQVEATSVGMSREVALAHLREELSGAGAGGHEELTSDAAVIALGDSWLVVLSCADEAAVRLLRDRERAAIELEAWEELGDGNRVDQLDDLRATVREVEAEIGTTRRALCEVVEARLKLHLLAATELSLAEEHDDRLVQRESAQVLVDLASRRDDGTAAVELAAAVPRGLGGPVPMVVVMGGAPASTLDRLRVLPDDVQVLVIGDAIGMDDWVAARGDVLVGAVEVGSLV